jgi:hypothetical protein
MPVLNYKDFGSVKYIGGGPYTCHCTSLPLVLSLHLGHKTMNGKQSYHHFHQKVTTAFNYIGSLSD